jgi:hypothetical protein
VISPSGYDSFLYWSVHFVIGYIPMMAGYCSRGEGPRISQGDCRVGIAVGDAFVYRVGSVFFLKLFLGVLS